MNTIPMAKGHLDQERSNLQSMKNTESENTDDEGFPPAGWNQRKNI